MFSKPGSQNLPSNANQSNKKKVHESSDDEQWINIGGKDPSKKPFKFNEKMKRFEYDFKIKGQGGNLARHFNFGINSIGVFEFDRQINHICISEENYNIYSKRYPKYFSKIYKKEKPSTLPTNLAESANTAQGSGISESSKLDVLEELAFYEFLEEALQPNEQETTSQISTTVEIENAGLSDTTGIDFSEFQTNYFAQEEYLPVQQDIPLTDPFANIDEFNQFQQATLNSNNIVNYSDFVSDNTTNPQQEKVNIQTKKPDFYLQTQLKSFLENRPLVLSSVTNIKPKIKTDKSSSPSQEQPKKKPKKL